MKQIIYDTNPQGIRVKKCCCACRWKALTRAVSLRRCTRTGKDVEPMHTCRYWEMSETMKLAGKSQGVVRDKDTKEVVF